MEQAQCEACGDYYPADETHSCRLRHDRVDRTHDLVLQFERQRQTWREVGAAFPRESAEARAHNLRLVAKLANRMADESVGVWEQGNSVEASG